MVEVYLNNIQEPIDDLKAQLILIDLRNAVVEVMRKYSEDGRIIER